MCCYILFTERLISSDSEVIKVRAAQKPHTGYVHLVNYVKGSTDFNQTTWMWNCFAVSGPYANTLTIHTDQVHKDNKRKVFADFYTSLKDHLAKTMMITVICLM